MTKKETINPVVYGPNNKMVNFPSHSWMFKMPANKRISDLSTKQLMDIGYFDE